MINKSPLHIAAFDDLDKIGEVLISEGVDINAIDIIYQISNLSLLIIFIIEIIERNFNNNNMTSLHSVAYHESINIGKLLVLKGADILAKDIIY